MQPEPAKPSGVPAVTPPSPSGQCANCGAPLYGKYCFACGQPTIGMVRHFHSVMSDIADSVLNVDERLFKTLVPLYLQPGRLTLDYFAGKRARYVTPFRLVFFLAIIAFFALQISFRTAEQHAPLVALAVGTSGIHGHIVQTAPQQQDQHFSDDEIRFNHKVLWNAQSKPLRAGWLPGFVNDWLNDLVNNARINMHRANSGDPAQMRAEAAHVMAGMFAVAPTVLFVLLPFFALLLKIFYLFKRRLYMEHLIVAMHSHAFLMLSMLVLVALGLLRLVSGAHVPWLAAIFALAQAAATIWVIVYLFLMQKRVYGQGRLMTAIKFWCIGWCYTLLVACGLVFAFLASLTGA